METSVVTSKGQIVIPTNIRKLFGIKKGTVIHFIYDKDEIKIIPITKETIRSNFGVFGTKGKILKALRKVKRSECEL